MCNLFTAYMGEKNDFFYKGRIKGNVLSNLEIKINQQFRT